ncbi:Uncharacterised protein [uncultured Butyricicoccus sp.]|uniref:Uncharacterized protein n=1 Tax=Agathobaculum ammoniilyticum TaxID=2981778 RepID=A0ABT2U1S8_9FIRM|nr:hypothetical protein [Agathobaculum ammoniilyticum]MBS6883784.1 hypothetical protein [Clostridiaceae bacterium]MCU6788581.1 hypothetical protein [Agathobaculum ammoniilyticum]SCI82032.1 Uncharacterised protein [uncultured Butyricicoccus sp.]
MTRTRKKVKLEKCSKPELIWVIRRMCQYALSERELRLALNDLEYKRESDRIEKANALLAEQRVATEQYIDLLRRCEGKQLKISHPKRWSRLMQRFPERVLLIGCGVN